MEESVGMAVAMNEVLQDAGRSGNALKSISAGMAGLTVSAKDGTLQLTKAGMAMKEVAGIEVWNQKTGEIKDMYEVMDELSLKWDDLSEAEQSALGTAIAGKTQFTAFSALLSNWDTAKQYVADYKEGLTIGSAEKENAQYIDSIAGKWNTVKENMKAVGNTLVTSDTAKGFLDGLIVATEGLDSFTKHATTTFSSIFSGDIGKQWSDGIYETLEQTFGGFGGFTEIGNKIATTLSDAFGGVGGKLLESMLERMSTFGGTLGRLKNIFDIFDKGTSSKELSKAIDERTENINAIKAETNSLKNQKQAMDELIPTYDNLSKKQNRSAKENQELAQLKEQLASIDSNLVLGYDQDGSPILKNLKLQSKELEAQIKLKQQAQRIEENALAMDTLERRVNEQKEYNKALKEYNDMSLVSSTKRKEGLFGEEDLTDYAKRLKENNDEVTKSNEEAYQKRLEAHQQYVADEKAIQEKYLNQLEQNMSFKNLTDEGKANLLTFADALDWSKFSLADGNKFTNQLSNLGEKITDETKNMGEFSKAITKIGEDYANGKTNLIDYTEALGKQYELAGKFDTESFTAWQQGLQSYVNMTGDLNGMNKVIDSMATSLNKVTGIDVSTWKSALSFDPAPLDASNKALQKFLNSYGTGIQNLGKGGLADTLTSQFETLQNSYTQMVSDLAGGKEIDVEYLINAKVNQPEPISNLIDEIIEDNGVTEKEIEILLNAQAELLNTGEISQETIAQIAEEFNMTEAEVTAMLNVKTEVNETGEPFEQIKNKWDNFEAGEKILTLVQKAIGGDEFQLAKTLWDGLDAGEKVQTLLQKVTGGDLIQKAKSTWEGLSTGEKIQTLVQAVNGGDALSIAKSIWDNLNVGEKVQTLLQKVTGSDLIKSAGDWFTGLFEGEKTQTLTQRAEGKEEVESASQAIEKLPSKKEVTISIVQAGANLISGIGDWLSSLATKNKQTITVEAKVGNVDTSAIANIKVSPINITATVTGTDAVNSLKTAVSGLTSKNVAISASVSGTAQVSTLKNTVSTLQGKSITVTANTSGTTQVNALKTAISGLKGKSVAVNSTVSGTDKVNALRTAITNLQAKTVAVTANVTGTDKVKALTSAINNVKSKSVKVSASVSGTEAVRSLASAIGNVQSKTVSVKVNRSIVTTEKTQKASIEPNSPTNIPAYTPMLTPSLNTDMNMLSSAMASDVAPINVPVTASASSRIGTLSTSQILPSLNFDISRFKNLEEALERLGNQMDILDEKSENTFGTKKIDLLNQQIALLKQQKTIQQQIADGETREKNQLIQWLKADGFKFDTEGNITNYNDKLLAMEKNVESLKNRYDQLNDSSNKNETAVKNAQRAYDSASEGLSKSKKYLDEYFATFNSEIPESYKKLEEYENQIKDIQKTIRELNNEKIQIKIDGISDTIDFLDARIEGTTDKQSKINDLTEQNRLYREQQNLVNELAKQMKSQLTTINSSSDEYAELTSEITKLNAQWWELESAQSKNYESIVDIITEGARNKIEGLEKELEYVQTKAENVGGKDKHGSLKKQITLYEQQRDTIASLVKELTKQAKMLDNQSEQYMNTIFEIKELNTEWEEVNNSIKEAQDEIEKFQKEMAFLSSNSKLTDIENQFNRIEHSLDVLNEKLEYAWGSDKIKLMTEELELLNQQLEIQKDKVELNNEKLGIYQESLKKYGAIFDNEGNMTNYTSLIDAFKDSGDLERITELTEEYIDVQDEVRDSAKGYYELETAIKDLYNEQLEVTKDIEDEITEIYEKEYERREKELEDFYDKQIELLNKEKDAYKEMREQQDYEKTVQEQTDEIASLQKQLEVAKKDDSVGGLKRQKELLEEIEEAQKELQETTQDKIDSDFEKNIDKEIERLENEQDDLINELNERFSETNIGKLVAESMKSGLIEINGEVKTLQDALLSAINDNKEGYSAMASIVKNELVSNLNVALETMKNITSVYQGLNLQDFGKISTDINRTQSAMQQSSVNNKTITIGDTIINVSGSVDDVTLERIEEMIKEENERMLNKITNNL